MDDTRLRLDGNACAGLLEEIFAGDVTASRGRCAACGAVDRVGAQLLYGYPTGAGAVLRCSSCENVLMVVVEAEARYRLGFQGMTWLEFEKPV